MLNLESIKSRLDEVLPGSPFDVSQNNKPTIVYLSASELQDIINEIEDLRKLVEFKDQTIETLNFALQSYQDSFREMYSREE